MFLPTDEQVGQIDVALIIHQRAAVDAARMQAMGQCDGGRGHAVPFILAARMEIDVGLTQYDRHRLRPGRSHRHQFRVQRLRDRHRFGGRPRARHHHAQLFRRRRHGARFIRPQHDAALIPRQCHRTDHRRAVDRQPDMHRPVGPRLAIFARAIDRIDDPDTRLGEPVVIVLLFFGQQTILAPHFAQRVAQKLVGGLVARLAQRLCTEHPGFTHLDQYAPGHLRQMGGQCRVAHPAHGISRATMASAASSAVMVSVSIWISGSTGAS